MAKVYVFNTSSVSIMFSINEGDYALVNGTSGNIAWTPLSPNVNPQFVNNKNPANGAFGLGSNILTLYPTSSGTKDAATFTVSIPINVQITSIQLYLYWKDARNTSLIYANGGQLIQTINAN